MTKVITMHAVIARINRKLRHDDEKLQKSRGSRFIVDVGRYYVRDLHTNFINAMHVDPATLGRELGVLRDWEAIEEEPVEE